MNNEKKYGWTNRNTWNAYNLMSMNEDIYSHYQALKDTYSTKIGLAKAIENSLFEFQEIVEVIEPMEMENINWNELAEALMEG